MRFPHQTGRSVISRSGVLACAALSLVAFTAARAQGHLHGEHRGDHVESPLAHGEHAGALVSSRLPALLIHQMDLTEAQRADIHDLLRHHHLQVGKQADGLHQARGMLALRIHAEVLDEVSIREAAAAVAEFEADLAVARAEFLQELRQILTADQLTELHRLLTEDAASHESHGLHLQQPAHGAH